MPRILPPIAPRAPSHREAHATPSEINNSALPVPDSDPMDRVRALVRNPERYIREPNPFTMALWATMNEPAAVVITRHAAAIKAMIEAQQLPAQSDEPGERPVIATSLPPTVTAFQAVTDAVVARAIQGDQRSADMIAERLEGRAGQRRGDIDPEAEAQRGRVRAALEQIVRDMADRAIGQAEPIDVTPHSDTTQ